MSRGIRFALSVPLCVLALGIGACGEDAPKAPKWSEKVAVVSQALTYSKKFTIAAGKVSADLQNFPVLVSITDSDLGAKSATSADIRFYDSDDATKLDYEIESYTSSTGVLVAWVRLPWVYTASATDFYMRYGDGNTTNNPPNADGTWETNFRGVYHMMAGGGTNTEPDKSGNGNNAAYDTGDATCGTTNTRPANLATGKIGAAITFGGNTCTRLITADANSLEPSSSDGITLSGWMYTTGTSTVGQTLLQKRARATNSAQYGLRLAATAYTLQYYSGAGTGTSYTSTLAATANQWQYGTVTIPASGTGCTFYLNGGTAAGGSEGTVASCGIDALNSGPLWLGGFDNGTTDQPFIGSLDELRVVSTPRAAAWIAAEYSNQNSPSTFYSYTSGTGLYSRGDSCSSSGQCISGNCVDGVCCDTACGSGVSTDCQACGATSLSGAGTCGVVKTAAQVCRGVAGACDVADVCAGPPVSNVNYSSFATALSTAPTTNLNNAAEATCTTTTHTITTQTTSPYATFTDWCGTVPTPVLVTTQTPNIVVIPLKGLTLDALDRLNLRGTLPVVLLIDGNATINGIIDAGSTGTSATVGPGGGVACTSGTSASQPNGNAGSTNGIGGNGGAFGASDSNKGGNGNNNPNNIGAATAEGTATLVPLRAGCNGAAGGAWISGGGTGGGGAAGKGGGAVQISVTGTLNAATTGQIQA